MKQTNNRTVIVGRLGAVPQIHYTQRGVPFAVLSLSSNRGFQTKDGQIQTTWHRVVAWDKLGLICSRTLGKGSLLCIEGALESRLVKKAGGSGERVTEIVARSVKQLDRGLPSR